MPACLPLMFLAVPAFGILASGPDRATRPQMKTRLDVAEDIDIVAARQKGREMAVQLGLSAMDATLIATAISELARNMLLYAQKGEILLGVEHGRSPMFVIEARDHGPGIADPEQAMLDGYSTSGGLGMGLSGTRRIMDGLEIISIPGEGTRVIARKRIPPGSVERNTKIREMLAPREAGGQADG